MSESPWRRDTLGASDAPAIVGVDPFRTGGDLWAQKTGRLPADADRDPRALDVRRLGQALTPVLVAVAEARLARPLAPEVFYRHPTAPLSATVDGIAVDDPAVLVEVKTAGLVGGQSPLLDAYGESGTDDVPESVIIQCHHTFGVLDAQPGLPRVRRAFIVALLGGRGLQTYEVARDDDLVADLLDREQEWWQDHVVGDRCPPNDPPSLPILKRLPRRSEAPPRIIDPVLVSEWQQAKVVLKQAEQNEATCRGFVINELGDGEIGECQLGRVTYFETARAAYTVGPTKARTLRFTPTRARKVA
jgi:predicted phage-related endonuclease